MACSWDPSLIEEAARVTAREMRATGLSWTFSPVLCLARDLRWGRVDETFGEDPHLIGEFASAMIRGYQGRGLGDPDAVLATAKHYAGYSETLGGRDASEADLSRRKLRSCFMPPFERAAREGCMAFMTGYQSIDGVPSTINRWLLEEVLTRRVGLRGRPRHGLRQHRAPGDRPTGLRRLCARPRPSRSPAATISSWPRLSFSRAASRRCAAGSSPRRSWTRRSGACSP